MGNIFGDIDVSEIPDDPFWVDDGTYLAVLGEIKVVENEEKDTHGLSFNWTITEDDSEFEGSRVQDWKTTYPNLVPEDVTKEIKADLSRLKNRLSQIGVPEEDMNDPDLDLNDYVGTEAYITVKNTTNQDDPSKKYRNVTWVRLPEGDDE
jgi:hypothetical protein